MQCRTRVGHPHQAFLLLPPSTRSFSRQFTVSGSGAVGRVQFVPGMRFLVIDFTVQTRTGPRLQKPKRSELAAPKLFNTADDHDEQMSCCPGRVHS
eukprot:3886769-Rhodomonas_salina.5